MKTLLQYSFLLIFLSFFSCSSNTGEPLKIDEKILEYSASKSKEQLIKDLFANLPEMSNLSTLLSYCEPDDDIQRFAESPEFYSVSKYFMPSRGYWNEARSVGFREKQSNSDRVKAICVVELKNNDFLEIELVKKKDYWFLSEKGFGEILTHSLLIGQPTKEDLMDEMLELFGNQKSLRNVVPLSNLVFKGPDRIEWETLGKSLQVNNWVNAQFEGFEKYEPVSEDIFDAYENDYQYVARVKLTNGYVLELMIGQVSEDINSRWIFIFNDNWYKSNPHEGRRRRM